MNNIERKFFELNLFNTVMEGLITLYQSDDSKCYIMINRKDLKISSYLENEFFPDNYFQNEVIIFSIDIEEEYQYLITDKKGNLLNNESSKKSLERLASHNLASILTTLYC
jgi:uncharacterized protein YdaL